MKQKSEDQKKIEMADRREKSYRTYVQKFFCHSIRHFLCALVDFLFELAVKHLASHDLVFRVDQQIGGLEQSVLAELSVIFGSDKLSDCVLRVTQVIAVERLAVGQLNCLFKRGGRLIQRFLGLLDRRRNQFGQQATSSSGFNESGERQSVVWFGGEKISSVVLGTPVECAYQASCSVSAGAAAASYRTGFSET